MEDKILVTKEHLERMKEDLKQLKEIARPEIIERIKVARSFGDLSENSEYDSARDEQGRIESKIAELDTKIKNAKIISNTSKSKKITIGSEVKILDLNSKKELTYFLVGTDEINPFDKKISTTSPLGQVLEGREVDGEELEFLLPNGNIRKIKIISFK